MWLSVPSAGSRFSWSTRGCGHLRGPHRTVGLRMGRLVNLEDLGRHEERGAPGLAKHKFKSTLEFEADLAVLPTYLPIEEDAAAAIERWRSLRPSSLSCGGRAALRRVAERRRPHDSPVPHLRAAERAVGGSRLRQDDARGHGEAAAQGPRVQGRPLTSCTAASPS